MKIVRKEDRSSSEGRTFTGKVSLDGTLHAQQPGGVSLSVVHFHDGAVTHWHVHPGEQILYVLEGEGRVGTETEVVQLRPGDVVYARPGEKHWHGAESGRSMSHISITTVGSPEWFDAPEV